MEALERFCTRRERDDHIVLRELARNLLSANPLYLDGCKHQIFWRALRAELSRDFEAGNEFSIVVDLGEITLQTTYYSALSALLLVLTSPAFHAKLLTVQSLPNHVVTSFSQRKCLQRYFISSVLGSVYDAEDQFRQHRSYLSSLGPLSYQLYPNDTNFYANDSTPEHTYFPLLPVDSETGKRPAWDEARAQPIALSLPPRRAPNDQTAMPIAQPQTQLRYLAGVCSYVFTAMREFVESTSAALRSDAQHSHYACVCIEQLFTMDTLLNLFHMLYTQSLDLRSLSRPAFKVLFKHPALLPVVQRLAEIAQHFHEYRTELNTPGAQRVDYHIDAADRLLSAELHEEIYGEFAELQGCEHLAQDSVDHAWDPVRLDEWPVKLFLEALDIRFGAAYWSVKLRHFLEHKSRSTFTAYGFPNSVELYELEKTLLLLRERYAAEWPQPFRDCCTALLLGRVFLVATPSAMHALRMMLLLERTLASPLGADGEARPFSAAVFGREAGLEYISKEPYLRTLATYAAAKTLAYNVGGPSAAAAVALPSSRFFPLYDHLPKLAYALTTTQPESDSLLLAFLAYNTTYYITPPALAALTELIAADPLLSCRDDLDKLLKFQKPSKRAAVLGSTKLLQLFSLLFELDARTLYTRVFPILTAGLYQPKLKPIPRASVEAPRPPPFAEMPAPSDAAPEEAASYYQTQATQLYAHDCFGVQQLSQRDLKLNLNALRTLNSSSAIAKRPASLQQPFALAYARAQLEYALLRYRFSAGPLEDSWRLSTLMPACKSPDSPEQISAIPVTLKPERCDFERCFFIRKNIDQRRDQLRTTDHFSHERILTSDDSFVLDSRILRRLAVQYSQTWSSTELVVPPQRYVQTIVECIDYLDKCKELQASGAASSFPTYEG